MISSATYILRRVAWLNSYGVKLAIARSRVRPTIEHFCITTLLKLFTPVSWHQAV